MKKKSIASLKKTAWKLLSECIRKESSTQMGYVMCYTCQKRMHWKESQAGHFIAGRTNSILFDERGIRVQCAGCNIFSGGRPVEFMIGLEKELGIEEARELRDELIVLKNTPRQFIREELEQMINEYKGRLK